MKAYSGQLLADTSLAFNTLRNIPERLTGKFYGLDKQGSPGGWQAFTQGQTHRVTMKPAANTPGREILKIEPKNGNGIGWSLITHTPSVEHGARQVQDIVKLTFENGKQVAGQSLRENFAQPFVWVKQPFNDLLQHSDMQRLFTMFRRAV